MNINLMAHDDAVNAALLVLGAALVERHPDPNPAAGAQFVLQQLRAGQVEAIPGLADRTLSIRADVLLALVGEAMRVPVLEEQLRQCEASSAGWLGLWNSARKIMKKPGKPHDKRTRLALFELGLIGEESGQGKSRVDHRGIADHYFLLRKGGHYWSDVGTLDRIEPHGHDAAVQMIEKRYSIDWDTLVRGCARKGIAIKTKAEVFPIP